MGGEKRRARYAVYSAKAPILSIKHTTNGPESLSRFRVGVGGLLGWTMSRTLAMYTSLDPEHERGAPRRTDLFGCSSRIG